MPIASALSEMVGALALARLADEADGRELLAQARRSVREKLMPGEA